MDSGIRKMRTNSENITAKILVDKVSSNKFNGDECANLARIRLTAIPIISYGCILNKYYYLHSVEYDNNYTSNRLIAEECIDMVGHG